MIFQQLNDVKTSVKIVFFMLLVQAVIMTGTVAWAQRAGGAQESVVVEFSEWQVLAASPGVDVVSKHVSNPGRVVPLDKNPVDAAYNWLLNQGFEEGRNIYNDRLLYISVGSAVINARPQDPAFIDSRFLALQRAELEARAKMAIFLGVDLTTERGMTEREINPLERAQMEELVQASPVLQQGLSSMGVRDQVQGIMDKALRLADSRLDQALSESGADLEAERREAARQRAADQARRDKMANLRNISDASFRAAAAAFADVQGIQTIQAFEGSYRGGYRVVVVSMWSRNMQRMVDIMSGGRAPHTMPINKAREEVVRQLPTSANELACLNGVRVYINQRGENVLLAFGQAGVEVLGGREDKAFETASSKARLRAMAAVRTFMGELVAFSASEELKEVLALYANEYQGVAGGEEYRSISQFQQYVIAAADKQHVTGVHGLKTFELTHPFTDRPLVLQVMAWSPASQAAAQGIPVETGVSEPAMVEPETPRQRPVEDVPARKGLIDSGAGADRDAF